MRGLLDREAYDGAAVYPITANLATNPLYSNKEIVSPHDSVKPFRDFTRPPTEHLINRLLQDGEGSDNFKEELVNRYHLRGLRNRLAYDRYSQQPRCVALTGRMCIL